MAKELSSVEWLLDWMGKNQYFIGNDLLEAVEQAKLMEEAQMKIAWHNAIDAQLKDKWDSYDDFHNTTFKSE